MNCLPQNRFQITMNGQQIKVCRSIKMQRQICTRVNSRNESSVLEVVFRGRNHIPLNRQKNRCIRTSEVVIVLLSPVIPLSTTWAMVIWQIVKISYRIRTDKGKGLLTGTGIPNRADTRYGSKIQVPSFPSHANTSGSARDNPPGSTPHTIQLLSTIHARHLPYAQYQIKER